MTDCQLIDLWKRSHNLAAHFELTGSTVTKYYFAGTQRIAMRKYTIPSSMSVEYLLGDHLGSTSLTTDKNGVKTSEMRYKPWGEVRYSWTSQLATTPAYMLSNYTFTGQYSYMDDLSTPATEGFGLMFYNARMYDPALGRFTSADTIVPEQSQGVQAWDRYAYVNNNPIIYNDPSGHFVNVLIGAAIGAIINTGLYLANETMRQDGFDSSDWGDLAVAATQGAVVGGLIGSGVGAATGVTLAMSAGLGAASSLAGDQVSNLITGNDYDAVTTTMGAAAGAFTGYVGTGLSTGSRVLLTGVVEGSSDTLEDIMQGYDVGVDDFAENLIWNMLGESMSSSYKNVLTNPMDSSVLPTSEIEAEILSNTLGAGGFQVFQETATTILESCVMSFPKSTCSY